MGRKGIVTLVALALAAPAAAQERVEEVDLPRDVADEVVEFFNDDATLRFTGPTEVPDGRRIVSDVAVLGGTLAVGGRITGDVVVVNGDLRVEEAGLVDGDVTVIGGEADLSRPDAVTGTLTVYDEPLRYRRRGRRIEVSEPDRDRRPLQTDFGPGRSHFTIRAGRSYNRVEGLPVMLGPIVRTSGSSPLRVEALATLRTEEGLSVDGDDVGYLLKAEQRFGRSPRVAVGATVHSEVTPVEDWGLSDLESSLATFLLHKDYRDHFEREGWSAYARVEDRERRLSLTLEYRDEDHAFAPVGSPWTIRKNDDPWRPQPLVGEGDVRTVSGELTWDDRDDEEDPSDGWYARLGLTRGLGDDLLLPDYTRIGGGSIPDEYVDVTVPGDFTTAYFDLRRHLRVSPDADLTLRLLGGGSLDDGVLPPQLQRALGGEGSLPGYRLFSLDCGARDVRFTSPRAEDPEDEDVGPPTVFAGYGCDRTVLFQAQYTGQLFFDIDLDPDDDEWDEDWDWYPVVDFSPRWVAFFDAGRGWVSDDGPFVPGLERRDSGSFADVGVGIFLGDLGLFWALPLDGEDRDLNFFVRLSRRF